jgi:hypothetical protein
MAGFEVIPEDKKACALGDKVECSRVRNDEPFR